MINKIVIPAKAGIPLPPGGRIGVVFPLATHGVVAWVPAFARTTYRSIL
jgi:hypothetical protein